MSRRRAEPVSTDGSAGLARRFFDALSAGCIDDALVLLDEDAVWWVAGRPEDIPLGGSYRKSDIPGMLKMVFNAVPDGIQLTINTVTAQADRAVLEAEVHGVSPSGKVYDNRNIFVVEVGDNRIRAIREYYDTIHTNAVLFNNTY